MTTPTQANPSLGAFTPGYDPIAHTTGVALRVANIQTDSSVTPNVTYGDLGVDVTVTVAAITNDGTFAKETGGNLATLVTQTTGLATQTTLAQVKTDLDTLVTNTADLLADGDNLATIATNTTGVATAANQATANTSLASVVSNTANNTNIGASGDAAVVGDNAGSLSAKLRGLTKILNDIWDSVNHLFHANIKQWNGAVPSVSNPVITEDQIRAWIIAGQGYQASTGKLTAAAATQAFSVFVPNTLTKNILIYSLKIGYSNASTMHDVRVVTTDPAFANNATISNSKQGGAATNGVTSTYATTTQTASGTVFDAPETGANTPVDSFTGGQYYYIPAGTAGGLAIYFGNTAAGSLSATAKWIEI